MSFSLLPLDHEDIINGLPSFNMFNNTLLLIQTIKNMPSRSITCLDGHDHDRIQEQEDSLGVQVANLEKPPLQTPQIKRKKTGCTCRKTNCLKNYCECFSTGKQCTPQCACYGCYNTHQHEQLVKQTKAQIKCKSSRKTSPGCICKKSQCQKKYCECFNAGVACTQACKCIDCQNNIPHSHSSEESSHEPKNKYQKNKSKSKEDVNKIQLNINNAEQNFHKIELNSQNFSELNL